MKTEDFSYHLPAELIAHYPPQNRLDARLMRILREENHPTHHRVADLPSFLAENDCLVINNTKVIPARAFGTKPTGGKVEVLFLRQTENPTRWKALLRASKRPKLGSKIRLNHSDIELTFAEELELGACLLDITGSIPLLDYLDKHGQLPLPPYIERAENKPKAEDREDYQTAFASQPGAVAAPTAGLHFTPELLEQISDVGVKTAEITLHVGLGTFQPVKVDQVEDHNMHSERYRVSPEAAATMQACKDAGGRIVAVGTTSARTLETMGSTLGKIGPCEGETDIFIYPPYSFKVVDMLFTNFHLPESTLLMMVSAFAGKERIEKAYAEAIEKQYRFFSYGDCMLLS